VCNLYTNKSTVQEMAKLFGTPATYRFNAPSDVYPQYPGIVVREDKGQRILQQMTWGFWRIYRQPRVVCAEGECGTPSSNRLAKTALWLATALIGLAVLFP